jgi:protein phosphatase
MVIVFKKNIVYNPVSKMNKLDYYSLSFAGRRKNNQDSCIVLKPSNSSIFLAVADGMGGAAGGEVASKSVLDTAEKVLKKKFEEEVQPEHLKDILKGIFYFSQIDISNKIKENSELIGMGTTLTCVLILDDKFVWGNIGDSRIYRYTQSELTQISIDHTHIQEYIDKVGTDISKEFIDNHGHILTRAINGGNHIPDIFPSESPFESLESGDAFLLCSDGMILDKMGQNNSNLKNYLVGIKELKDVAENLVSYAYNKGSNFMSSTNRKIML